MSIKKFWDKSDWQASNVFDLIRVILLCLLILFIPLSAWLVSLTGNYLVSLGRDILLVLFLILSLIETKEEMHHFNGGVRLVSLFVLLTLGSFFVKEDALGQWLRGVRYLTEPLVLFASLMIFPLPGNQERAISKTVLVSLVLILIAAFVDYAAPQLLRFSFDSSGRGFLGQIHLAGGVARLQSTLAGPNALGLFLLVTLLLAPLWQRFLSQKMAIFLPAVSFIVLIFTFSRSSYIGLLAGIVYFLILARNQIKNASRYLMVLLGLVVVVSGVILVFKPGILTRTGSNEIRLQQFERVWEEHKDIGFWGRGAGTTGLVSEYSFDNSPNHFSENTYLNMYENIGLVGALTYLAFWVWLVWTTAKTNSILGLAVSASAFGLAVAGLFIDHYTGQAALWITLLTAGIILSNQTAPVTIQETRPNFPKGVPQK